MTDILNSYREVLELDKILNMLAREAQCNDSCNAALELEPAFEYGKALRALDETDQAYTLMAKYGRPSFRGLNNLDNILKRADSGAMLSCGELLNIAGVLSTIRGVCSWRKHFENESLEGKVTELLFSLSSNKYLEDEIYNAIISEEEVSDNASPQLQSVRRKLKQANQKVRDQLDRIINNPSVQKYLQDSVVTIRDGRFVVPVKQECRGMVPGILHDTSASGATVFIEPISVVEANNEIRVLESEEKQEIERILRELSRLSAEYSAEIIRNYRISVKLDLIFAKASLGFKMKAIKPKLKDNGGIFLKKARHPLIDPKEVVAVDLELGIGFDTLIITGPNTGGKTVALKTIGLLTLMAACGLMIPAADESYVSVFDRILVDIDSKQSIEQNLSTFSAHMLIIKNILKHTNSSSLVLLDELGSGTDPVEGAALATSIIESLRQKGAKIAATTHYSELKTYALRTKGVINGSCEFDFNTLSPTYKILIGVAGKSNAFEISAKLGIPADIIERAKSLIVEEKQSFEDVMQQLEIMRQNISKQNLEAERLKALAEQKLEEIETEYEKASLERERIIESARKKSESMIAECRFRYDSILKELDELRSQTGRQDYADRLSRAKDELKKHLRQLEKTANIQSKPKKTNIINKRPLKAGDEVLIIDLNKRAVLTSDPDEKGNVELKAGIIKTRMNVSNLKLIEAESGQKGFSKAIVDIKQRRADTDLDLRGKTVDEALVELENFIDNSVLLKLSQITVIHGKGTGALRTAVHQFLKRTKAVKSFRLGMFGEGEDGVTVIELK